MKKKPKIKELTKGFLGAVCGLLSKNDVIKYPS
jgi:hypothetical protein